MLVSILGYFDALLTNVLFWGSNCLSDHYFPFYFRSKGVIEHTFLILGMAKTKTLR